MDVIYALIDPRTECIRYVGKTNQPLSYRLSAHLRETAKCHRYYWIQELKRSGLKPSITVLEVCGRWPWQETERFWIRSLRMAGVKLTNNTSGGDGVPDLPPEARERIRRAWLGRKHTPETRAKFPLRRVGYKASAETKRKHSLSMRGRKITWSDKIAESVRKVDAIQEVRIRERILAGERVCDLAKEFGLHRTTVTKIKLGRYFTPGQRS